MWAVGFLSPAPIAGNQQPKRKYREAAKKGGDFSASPKGKKENGSVGVGRLDAGGAKIKLASAVQITL